jgi:hypothetical protein
MLLRQYIIDNWMRGKWSPHDKSEGYISMIAKKTLESRYFDITNVATYVQKVLKDKVSIQEGLRVHLPYPVCFFEFEREEQYPGENYIDHLYCGALLFEAPWNSDSILCSCFMSTVETRKHLGKYHVYPIVDYEFPVYWTPESDEQIKYTVRPVIRQHGQKIVNDMLTIGYNISKNVLYSLALLNCKNLRTEVKSNHDGKTKSERKNIFRQEYHVLNVPLINRIASGEIKVDGEHGVPIHTVRGHMKTYTADKPLLGKHIGQWWWEPQIRGNAKYGIIEKDYRVENPENSEEIQQEKPRTKCEIKPALFNAIDSVVRKS